MTSGKIYPITIGQVLVINWNYPKDWKNPPFIEGVTFRNTLPANGTYLVVFSLGQEKELEEFKKAKQFNILYEAPKAVNINPDHGTDPRNTLIVFEPNEHYVEDKPVPKVPRKR